MKIDEEDKTYGTRFQMEFSSAKGMVLMRIPRLLGKKEKEVGIGQQKRTGLQYSLCHLGVFLTGEPRHETCHRVSCQSDIVLHLSPPRRDTTEGGETLVTRGGSVQAAGIVTAQVKQPCIVVLSCLFVISILSSCVGVSATYHATDEFAQFRRSTRSTPS